MTEVETKTALIGQHRSAVQWCRENGINPRDKSIIMVTSPRDIQGYACKINPIFLPPGLDPYVETDIYWYIKMINARYP